MTLPPWSVIPFAVMLVAIAVVPLVPRLSTWWGRPAFQLAVACALSAPAVGVVLRVGRPGLVVEGLVEYGQFIVLLACLFVIAGGISIDVDARPRPIANTCLLAIGAVLTNIIGTTGAAILLIRPLLKLNRMRRHVSHTVIFCVFIVANTGGLLTPLGDPPLFLGMIRGVPFLWTLRLAPEWLFVNGLLLVSYWALDRRRLRQEHATAPRSDVPASAVGARTRRGVRVRGGWNLLWFAVVVASVAVAPAVNGALLAHDEVHGAGLVPWRAIIMLGAAAASLVFTRRSLRYGENRFTVRPMLEVAALFFGIFLTMIPALQILRELAPRFNLTPLSVFAATGGLSTVLDNTPTYATFFEVGRTIAGTPHVAGVPEIVLRAVSLGAVICGAFTYIGNGPNLMVASIARTHGVRMPSFARYVVFALGYLLPVVVAMALVFLTASPWMRWAGGVIAAGYGAWCLLRAFRERRPEG